MNKTLIDITLQHAISNPQKIAFTFLRDGKNEENAIDYHTLDKRAKSVAGKLQTLTKPRDRVLLLFPSGLDFIVSFLACMYANTVAVPAYLPQAQTRRIRVLEAIVSDSEAIVVLTSFSELEKMNSWLVNSPILKKLNFLTVDSLYLNDNHLSDMWKMPQIAQTDIAFLQYTSGSTGLPKGVIITHGNLIHNESIIKKAFRHDSNSIVVGWLPLYHDMGLIGNVLQPLYLGVPSILLSPITFLQQPYLWLKAISDYRGTTSGGPNFAYDLCISRVTEEQKLDLDLSEWKIAFNGSEFVRPSTIENFSAAFSSCGFKKEIFYPCYGLAESTLFVSGRKLDDYIATHQDQVLAYSTKNEKNNLVSVGKLYDENQRIIIVDPNVGSICKSGEVGEIWIQGNSTACGYWRKPELSELTFNMYTTDNNEGPFLRTGDLGFILNEELYITGRLKDLIIIRGSNYYPQDIEYLIEDCHPAFKNTAGAAFSVLSDNEERLVVIQEIRREFLKNFNKNHYVSAIRQTISENFSLQTHMIVLVMPVTLPKTTSGKIQRGLCKDQFIAGELKEVVEIKK